MLKLKSNKIYKSVLKHSFTQKLNFSHCERNILINTADIINVNKIKSKEFFIEVFFSIFIVKHFLEEGRQQVRAILVPQTDGGVRELCINMTIYGQL